MMLSGSFQWTWWCTCWPSWCCLLSWASSSSKGECLDLRGMKQNKSANSFSWEMNLDHQQWRASVFAFMIHQCFPVTAWYYRAVQRLADCSRRPQTAVKHGAAELRTPSGVCTWKFIIWFISNLSQMNVLSQLLVQLYKMSQTFVEDIITNPF